MKLKLLGVKELKDFPPASAIEYFDEKLYFIGNDAREVLVTNKRYKELDRIPLAPSDNSPKPANPDLVASTFIEVNKIPRLLLIGSGSEMQERNRAVLVNLDDYNENELDTRPFYTRIKDAGISSLNIESATMVLGELILSNRGNKSRPENHAIITSLDFYKDEIKAPLSILRFELPSTLKSFIGITGMAYSFKNDWLVLSFSSEDPAGDSFLGVVENAASKMTRKKIKVNNLINLSEADDKFKGHKVESVCIQSDKDNQLKLQLAAARENVSWVFKLRLN